MHTPRQIIYITIGSTALVLGAVGLFLPLLPTTPFWLLTAWCYLHSSPELYKRAMENPHFSRYIREYMEERALSMRTKVTALSTMWISITLTSIFLTDNTWVRISLLLISICVTIHLLRFPTAKKKE